MATAFERESLLHDRLSNHAFSLRFGLPQSLRNLHSRLGTILARSDFSTLQQAGIQSIQQLLDLPQDELEKILKGKLKISRVTEAIDKLREENGMSLQTSTIQTPAHAMAVVSNKPESVEVDGGYERERYLVKVNGFPVRLTGKSFKYFTRLAWSRLNSDSGWVFKEDIETGFNQARYLYRMKNEINAGLNSPWAVVENNRLGCYRLNIDPSRLRINTGNLRDHPDWDVRSLFVQV